MKTGVRVITVLGVLASTVIGMPLSNSIPMPINVVGFSSCRPPQNVGYDIRFDSVFGGHWELTGHRHLNRDGTYTDSFRGTVSDTSIHSAFTRNNFDWISDSFFICTHADLACTSFSMTISDGSVTGFAVYAPL